MSNPVVMVEEKWSRDGNFWVAKLNRKPSEAELDACWAHDLCSAIGGLYNVGSKRTIFQIECDREEWEQIRTNLVLIFRDVFGPTTEAEFIAKKWDPVPDQQVTIQTTWNWGFFKVSFKKPIKLGQTWALEQEIVPEGPVDNGIGDGDRIKRTGFSFELESGMEERAIECVIAALKKILGENVPIIHRHTAEKRGEGVTVVHVRHALGVDEEECSFVIKGVPAVKQADLLRALRRIKGLVNIEDLSVFGEEAREMRVGLESDEMEGDDPYGLAYSKIRACIRTILGDVKIHKRNVDGDGDQCLGELVFGELWEEQGAFTEEERDVLGR